MHPSSGGRPILPGLIRGYVAPALALAVLAVLLSAGCLGGFTAFPPDVVYPSIAPIEGAPSHPVTFTYAFEDSTVTLTVPISGPVFYGAQRAVKNATLVRDLPDERWIPGYYQAFVSDPAQEGFYGDVLSEFRRVKAEKNLDSDRYVELMAVAVQSMPYRTSGDDTPPRFPVETFAERTGDCDDKSTLLAGLLSREGYRVALLVFRPENHVAVGIAAPDCRYRNTSYAYVEATNLSLVGIPPEEIQGPIRFLTSDPLVIPIGNGTIPYGACGQTTAIDRALLRAREEAISLNRQLKAKDTEMDRAKSSGNTAEYNRMVPEYNRMVADQNRAVDTNNYILRHLYDRPGTYHWLKIRGLVQG
ncbi:MAG: hypothetical protein LUO91_00140 [Methanomicrobiales archaeon]|nr:hypothetical protein [Methanomicrobiales archaeon]